VNSMFALIPLMLAFGGANGLFEYRSMPKHGAGSAGGKRVMSNSTACTAWAAWWVR